jgi:gliding motility-associated-like protein
MGETRIYFQEILSNTFRETFRPFDNGTDKLLIKETACEQVAFCDSLKLVNLTDTICNFSDARIWNYTNKECGSNVVWQIDTSVVASIRQSNDTSLISFKKPWEGYLYGYINGSCATLFDSVRIVVLPSLPAVSLGADTAICPGNTLILNAKKGYTYYKWQDGSTDSVFNVTAPGSYWVEVASDCNGVFRDTVIVTAHPPIPLSIGPDRSKCNNDTLHLSAPNDFLNYTWYPNYNISSTTSANVTINPSVDTTYFLKAEKKPGCFAFDTVVIKVNHSTPINLGSDISFCENDSAVFDAGPGFTRYDWNTGNTGQLQVAKTAGTYGVIGYNVHGCVSSDSVRVLSVFQNPAVALDKSPSICDGTTKTFDAGAGYSSYLWDDGSTGRFRSAQSTGTFFVIVTDQNGCVGGDTSSINTIYPIPSSFLFPDTAICSYGKLDLVPIGNYSKYLWSNNSTSRTISINRPGTYWLLVSDQHNCEGKDTVVVKQKDCLSGFYVPNAFTPKANSHNGDFKPLLFGNVKKYEFSIFNRWGQMVFHTTELYKGWNGQLAGKEADPGTYIWRCVYQFEGQEVKMEKGSVVLLR